MNYRNSRTTISALSAFGLLLGAVVASGCNKTEPAAEAPSAEINKPGGAVTAPPEVKSQIQAAEAAESARRSARAGQQPK